MKPNTQTGEQFMKKIIKACLSALFAIGVTSSQNVDKFIQHLSEELVKDYPVEASEPKTELAPETTTPQNAPQAPQKEAADISHLVKDEAILKILRTEGIDTINKLILEMQKRSLTEISGITGVIEDEIRESLKEYNKA